MKHLTLLSPKPHSLSPKT